MTNINSLPQLSAGFTIANNADWTDVLQITEADNTTPLDITGITFESTIRETADSVKSLLTLSTDAGTYLNGGANGQLSFNVPALMLLDVPAGDFEMDLVASDNTGRRVNMFAQSGNARVTVHRGLTRDLNGLITNYIEWLIPYLATTPPQKTGVIWNNNGVLCVNGLIETLPTTPPAIAGKLWNNGGVLCISTGSPNNPLPTALPTSAGMLWSNGGSVSIS